MVRGIATRVPLRVAIGLTSVPPPGEPAADVEAARLEVGAVRGRGQLAVAPWVGTHASQSNLRWADSPRSPAATSITR